MILVGFYIMYVVWCTYAVVAVVAVVVAAAVAVNVACFLACLPALLLFISRSTQQAARHEMIYRLTLLVALGSDHIVGQ